MKRLLLALLMLSLPIAAQADSNTVSVIDNLKSLPLKEGFMWDFTHKRGLNTLGLGVLGYKGVELDLTWIGIDGIGATLNYNLANLPVKDIPIISYVQYLNIGYGIGWRTLALNPTSGNPKQDNEFIQGPVVFLKFKF